MHIDMIFCENDTAIYKYSIKKGKICRNRCAADFRIFKGYSSAMASISQRTPLGSSLTAQQLLAGLFTKNFA